MWPLVTLIGYWMVTTPPSPSLPIQPSCHHWTTDERRAVPGSHSTTASAKYTVADWNKKAQLTQGLWMTAVRVYRHLGFLKFESCTISSAVPENPTLETNSTSIGKTGCEVMAIFVYPRWPSAAILDFIESEIAPFDPPFPKTLA